MIFILISLPLLVLAGWILSRYYSLSYGMQTWHGFAIRFLSFCGFVCLFIGLFLSIYGEDIDYNIVDAKKSNGEGRDLPAINNPTAVYDGTTIRKVCDTCSLSPYFFPLIASQLDSILLIIPARVIGNKEYYCFRIGTLEKLLPVDKTELIRNKSEMSLITEKYMIQNSTWTDKCSERLKEIRYRVNLVNSFTILH